MRTGSLILIGIMFLGLQSCTSLHLRQSVLVQPLDWTLFGGSIERVNVSHEVLKPPLSPVWEYDASAGFSQYSAAVADSFLFVGNLQGEVHAVQIANGKSAGSYGFGSSIVGTPIIENDKMYVALTRNEDNLIAYNLLLGSVEWRTKTGDIESSPLVVGSRLYVTTLDGKLISMEKSDGSVVWKYDVPVRDRTTFIHSSPASDGEVIVFGCDNGILYAVGIADGKLRWSEPTGGSILASPSIAHGSVFVGSLDSTLYSFDLVTGRQIWKHRLGSKIYSSQAVGSYRVFVGTTAGMMYCLDDTSGATVWKATTGGVINAAPLLSGNVLYVGCLDKSLYAYDIENGEKLWEYKTEGRIKTTPVIAKNFLFLLAEDRSVIAFKHVEK